MKKLIALSVLVGVACGGEETPSEASTSGQGSASSSDSEAGKTLAPPPVDSALAGTRWKYDTIGRDNDYAVDFLDGGYFHRHKNTTATDRWTQEGEKVSMAINDGVKLEGRLIDGHTILGRGVNPGTAEWDFRMVRLPSLAELSLTGHKLPFVGTKWTLDSIGGGSGDTTVWILPERWHSAKDNNEAPDVWEKDGDRVTVSINGGIATYDLTVRGNHTMFGTAKNKEGKSWHVRLVREPSPAEISCGPRPETPLPGTVWQLESVGASVTPTWELVDDGKLYAKASAGNDEPETWKRSGDDVAVDINGGFVKYRGELRGDHTIVGWAENAKGKKWWFRALRVPSPGEQVCGR